MKLKFGLLLVVLWWIKWLSDISKNRWERSWLSKIGWLDAWKDAEPIWIFHIDLWHIVQGALYMIPLYMVLWYWLEYSPFREVAGFEYTGWYRLKKYDLFWSYNNYIIFIVLCILIWAVFYLVFSLGYHYFLMKPEFMGT